MSVVQMKRIRILGMKKDRKAILEFLQGQGAVQVSFLHQENDVLKTTDVSAQQQVFVKNAAKAEEALSALAVWAPEKTSLLSSLEGKKEIPVAEFYRMIDSRDEIMRLCNRVVNLNRKMADVISEVPKLNDQKTALQPWMNLDLPLDTAGTAKTAVFTGSLQGEQSLEQILTDLKKEAPDVESAEVEIISASPQQTCIFVVCSKTDEAAVRDALRHMNFAAPPVTGLHTSPAEAVQQIDKKISDLNAKQDEIRGKFQELAQRRDDIRFASDYYSIRAEKYGVLGQLLQTSKVFVVEGFIPEPAVADFEARLTRRFDAVVEIEEVPEDETPPVVLRNNAFAEPLEGVVESYSPPARGEMDPTFLAALFYYLLFGIMLGDAGYGLLLVIGTGLVLLKFKNMDAGLRKTLKMLLYCGISTTFWGVMFGSFFGDSVNVIASTFFNRPDVKFKPVWFEPLSEPMRMLAFCFLLAIIHMFVGLGAKGYQYLKNGQVLDAVYDVLFWYMTVGGCVIYLLTMPTMTEMLSLDKALPSALQLPAAVILIIGAVGIILTGGRESKNWFKRLLKGLYALYGISGWLSDVLSYSRLLALGLATGVIATVFNQMGTMAGNGPVGIVIFILVFIIGNILNLAINALGSYVHTNRLTYVEFFGKFYDGGGRMFAPFRSNTKYYKIKEDL